MKYSESRNVHRVLLSLYLQLKYSEGIFSGTNGIEYFLLLTSSIAMGMSCNAGHHPGHMIYNLLMNCKRNESKSDNTNVSR